MADVMMPSAASVAASGKKVAPAPAGATEYGSHMKRCTEECR